MRRPDFRQLGEERRFRHDRVQVAAPFRLGGTWQSQLSEKNAQYLSLSMLTALPAGSFYTEPAGAPHFFATPDGETSVQSHGYRPDNCELCGFRSCAEGVEIAADSTGDTCPGMECAHPSSRFEREG